MLYTSTRGNTDIVNFKEVTLSGLSRDGGLYVPKNWKKLNLDFNQDEPNFKEIALVKSLAILKKVKI